MKIITDNVCTDFTKRKYLRTCLDCKTVFFPVEFLLKDLHAYLLLVVLFTSQRKNSVLFSSVCHR